MFAPEWRDAIYLTGCDHRAEQTYELLAGPDFKQENFKRVLRATVQTHTPDLIAEEQHPDFLESRVKSKTRQSVALDLASELRICHRFCDPSRVE